MRLTIFFIGYVLLIIIFSIFGGQTTLYKILNPIVLAVVWGSSCFICVTCYTIISEHIKTKKADKINHKTWEEIENNK